MSIVADKNITIKCNQKVELGTDFANLLNSFEI